jgi:hypothetical protein
MCNCVQVVKCLGLSVALVLMVQFARLDIFLQMENMWPLASRDQRSCMATEERTLVVTCEDG